MLKKDKKRILFSTMCIFSTAILIGCEKNTVVNKNETFSEMYSEIGTFSSNRYKKYNAVMKDFNLGKMNFENLIDIDMKGIISYPKEKQNTPLLVILSGNENLVKDNISNKKLYKGYDYLAKSLSESGFTTLIIDTQFKDNNSTSQEEIVEDKILEQLFDYHLSNLKSAVNGEENIYGINLKGKCDLNNIGLIGQSSTARNIFNICNRKYENKDFSIKGLLSITPGESLSISSSYPDIPTSILVAEHSLNTSIGFDMYNEIEKDNYRKNFASLTYLIGGNSKKFNQEIEEEKILEAKVDEMSKITELKSELDSESNIDNSENENTANYSRKISKDAQHIINEEKNLLNENNDLVNDTGLHENFLSSYCVSFFKSIFDEDDEFKKIFNGESSSPTKMYGMNVLNKYYNPNKEVIYSSSINSKPSLKKIKVEDIVESDVTELDTATNFNEPTTTMQLNLKKLEWEKENPSIKIRNNKDYTSYKALNIRWAVNSSSSLNIAPQKAVSVVLKDKSGKTSTVALNSENSLRKIEGRERKLDSGEYNWSRYTPLSDTRISLSEFKNIDLKNIKWIKLSFNNAESGSVYIDEIYLVK